MRISKQLREAPAAKDLLQVETSAAALPVIPRSHHVIPQENYSTRIQCGIKN